MSTNKKSEFTFGLIGTVVGVLGLLFAIWAIFLSKDGNAISTHGNELTEHSNEMQEKSNDLSEKSLMDSRLERRIQIAQEKIEEGTRMQNELVEEYGLQGIPVPDSLKMLSFNLQKIGLDTLESIREKDRAPEAVRALIDFYAEYPEYDAYTEELRRDLKSM